jgi:cytochrome c oxidase cbb3-type subunit II
MHSRVPVAVLLVLALAACGGGEPPQPQDSQPAAAPQAALPAEAPAPFQLGSVQEEGKVVYETMCWSCHGSAGRGDGPAVVAGTVAPPRNLIAGDLSGAAVRRLQADFRAEVGSLDPGHPHMQNVLSIIDAEAFASALGYLPALAYPPELPGSAIAGHLNYILRCQGCHGASGQGNGPGADVLDLAPADFTRDTLLAARDFEAAFLKVRTGGGGVHGSSMPAWGVMFDDDDIWDLVAYIATFQPGVLSPAPSGG